ncbi:DNA-directed DNA polymerase gamma mip1 [Rhizina undulata]
MCTVNSETRLSELGIQHVSKKIHQQIFFGEPEPPPPELVRLSKEHLDHHELLGKTTNATPAIAFDVPKLQGQTLDEHFYKLGKEASEPYLDMAKLFTERDLPKQPKKWKRQSGWVKYLPNGEQVEVDFPDEEMLVFDVEVLYKESPFAIMACAASPNAWYVWLSPWLLGESDTDRHLVPLGDPKVPLENRKAKIVVGHNVGYDRARIKDEYSLQPSKTAFLDTMSLHVAVNGMCSRQRPTWMKHAKEKELREKFAAETESQELANMLRDSATIEGEEELWIERSSINSLRDVAKFHCKIEVDKSVRDNFGVLDREGVCSQLDELLTYCATDVAITHEVYRKVFPGFLNVCPHPVSFAALRHLSSVILPTNKCWEDYITTAEELYNKLAKQVQDSLEELVKLALEHKDDEDFYTQDPWLKQLDWGGMEIKMTKEKKTKKGKITAESRPVASQKLPGMPNWYKNLYKGADRNLNLTVRTRIAPLLLKLQWDGHPLVWSDKYGWTFKVTRDEAEAYEGKPVVKCDMLSEKNEALRDDIDYVYFKLPHKDGPTTRCTNPLAKSYLQYFEDEILSSEFELAKEALKMNSACSYWISARERIKSQMVIYEKDTDLGVGDLVKEGRKEIGVILPQLIPMGTITRRAVEKTWLTASNAKKNRVGSELKAMIKAPPGYAFVGADVDSQELWIASLVGDSQFKLHGGNAIGFMTLEGTKAAGTDLHSKTAKILGISRNNAKVFNYGRIYGAGLKFATTLLRQFNPSLTDAQAAEVAQNLYTETKGQKAMRKPLSERSFWRGGTESFVFNKLEEFADQDKPRTPVLGAGITEALMRRNLSKGGFMTSRINWAIQSSGVDYLHLLIVGMDYLIRTYDIKARLAITVHDEIRYLVREEDKYRCALALQVANLWTRAIFSQQMGINDLPQSCAFFSAVDIDSVLRKEVDMDCITPSHTKPIPPGESLDITGLLEKDEADLGPPKRELDVNKYQYEKRIPVMEALQKGSNVLFLRAQMTKDEEELNRIVTAVRKQRASMISAVMNPKAKKETEPRKKPKVKNSFVDEFEKHEKDLAKKDKKKKNKKLKSKTTGTSSSSQCKPRKVASLDSVDDWTLHDQVFREAWHSDIQISSTSLDSLLPSLLEPITQRQVSAKPMRMTILPAMGAA